jgi:nicotinate phosphoribosyltransferase
LLQVRRFHQTDGKFMADAIYEINHAVSEPCVIVDLGTEKEIKIGARTAYSDLLVPVFRRGEFVYQVPEIEASRQHVRRQLSSAPPEILKLNKPHRYKVGLEKSLHELRSTLIARARRKPTQPE